MSTIDQLHQQGVSLNQACRALAFPRSSYYYQKRGYGTQERV